MYDDQVFNRSLVNHLYKETKSNINRRALSLIVYNEYR